MRWKQPQMGMSVLSFLTGVIGLNLVVAAQPFAANRPDAERVKAITAFLDARPAGLGIPADNRAAWQPLAAKKSFQAVVAGAAKLLKKPIPELSEELYLDFSRTGIRKNWETVVSQRDSRLYYFALAECIENKGRFVAAYEAGVRELCAEPTWVMPAHDRSLGNFQGKQTDIDLRSSRIAIELATADYLLGDRLSPETRKSIREYVRRRVLEPYRDMITGNRKLNHWVTCTNNWNSVCHAGVVGAALWLVEPREERTLFLAAAEKHIEHFLQGFGNDGYCSEGVAYWNYGFGNFLLLAEMVHQATGGRVDLLANERARLAGLYGANIEIVEGCSPPFADCPVTSRPSDTWMWFVNRRFGLKDIRWERGDLRTPQGSLAISMIFVFPNSVSDVSMSDASERRMPPRTYFEQSGIVLCRPGERGSCRLGVGLKGGHNAEHHNHNDVGSYVAVVGRQMLLVDPGAEVYTARTFSADRYKSQVLNSFGHPVPIVDGQLQRSGADARGRILHTDFTDAADTIVLDMRSAYAVPELKKLQRTFVYSREGAGSLTVTDEVGYATAKPFGTALVTLFGWEQLGPAALRFHEADEELHVEIEATGSPFKLEPLKLEENIRTTKTATRIGINLEQPVTEATIRVTITPATRPSTN